MAFIMRRKFAGAFYSIPDAPNKGMGIGPSIGLSSPNTTEKWRKGLLNLQLSLVRRVPICSPSGWPMPERDRSRLARENYPNDTRPPPVRYLVQK